MEQLFKTVKKDFCSLWNFKQRGTTLEIITPFSTTTNKFVSVFVKSEGNFFIVSDGGWLSSEEYDISINEEDEEFKKLYNYYLNYYNVKVLDANDKHFYYKKTSKAELVSNIVNDVANFIANISSGTQIPFISKTEKVEQEKFIKNADNYLGALAKANSKKLFLRRSLDNEKLKQVRFSAVFQRDSRLTLIQYITGSTYDYFRKGISNANITFEIAKKSHFNGQIDKNIAIINSAAHGFSENKLFPYLDLLSDNTDSNNIHWSQRERLEQIV